MNGGSNFLREIDAMEDIPISPQELKTLQPFSDEEIEKLLDPLF